MVEWDPVTLTNVPNPSRSQRADSTQHSTDLDARARAHEAGGVTELGVTRNARTAPVRPSQAVSRENDLTGQGRRDTIPPRGRPSQTGSMKILPPGSSSKASEFGFLTAPII